MFQTFKSTDYRILRTVKFLFVEKFDKSEKLPISNSGISVVKCSP